MTNQPPRFQMGGGPYRLDPEPFAREGRPALQDYGVEYAGFWLRAGALLIDTLLLLVVGLVIAGVFYLLARQGGADEDQMLKMAGHINRGIGLAYFVGMECSAAQATFGKKWLGLKVTDLNGERISAGRAVGRYFAKILSTLIVLIGFFMAGFTARKQGLHDMIAGTLVVKSR